MSSNNITILHNPHDKLSREFVNQNAQYADRVLEYPDCIQEYPNISAFPSVGVIVPSYYQENEEIDGGLDENGDPIIITVPGMNVDSYVEILRIPNSWDDVNSFVEMVNNRSINSPYKTAELDD